MSSSPLITAADAIPLLDQAVFLDARSGPDSTSAYRQSHVAGALRVDLETDLSEPADPVLGGRHPLPSLRAWLARVGSWGVSPSIPVIVYDAAGGGMAAARAWWMLRAIGHEPHSLTMLRERYARILDDVPVERVVCYCGSGVTACHLLLAMEACGLSGAQLYVGSWSEWCRQERPGATG